MEAGHLLLVRVGADVFDQAIFVAHLLVAHGPVALRLGTFVVGRLLYVVLEESVLNNVILELYNGHELPLAVRPPAEEILTKMGQLLGLARGRRTGGYLRMKITLQLALQQEMHVVAVVVRVPFKLLQTQRLVIARVPAAAVYLLHFRVLLRHLAGILLQVLCNVCVQIPFPAANLLATNPSAHQLHFGGLLSFAGGQGVCGRWRGLGCHHCGVLK